MIYTTVQDLSGVVEAEGPLLVTRIAAAGMREETTDDCPGFA
jgi:hypothetical protein